MMHAFGFDEWRTAGLVLLRAGQAGAEQFFLPLRHERLILAMRGDDDAEFLRQLQSVIQLAVIDSERSFVSEENFEGGNAARNDLAKLPRVLIIKARHAHVIGVITRRFS